jgi:predicted RNase H-like HicB family nuclease
MDSGSVMSQNFATRRWILCPVFHNGIEWAILPRGGNMKLELTAVFRKVPEGYIAFIEELPGANTQGATLDEARSNLKEAAMLVLDANRTLSTEEMRGKKVIREPLKISA